MCRAYSTRDVFRYFGTSFHLVELVAPLVSGLNRRLVLNGPQTEIMGSCKGVMWLRIGKCGRFFEYGNSGIS